MPEEKRRRTPSLDAILTEMRGHGIILEEMRSQNRVTIEVVEASRAALEEKIDRADRESRERDAVLELAVRGVRKTVEKNSTEIRSLAGRVEALGPLDQRISRLERRSSK